MCGAGELELGCWLLAAACVSRQGAARQNSLFASPPRQRTRRRIPFALAFFTALLGYWARSGMPEPHTFLEAARREQRRGSNAFSARQLSLLSPEDASWEARGEVGEGEGASAEGARDEEEASPGGKKGSAEGGSPKSGEASGELPKKVPLFSVIRNNWRAITLQFCYTAW